MVELYSNISTRATQVALNVEKARIDKFTSLKEGSTTGDAELQDIRAGYDGTTYDTAGNAVRAQIETISDCIIFVKSTNLFNKADVVKGKYARADIGNKIHETEKDDFSYIIVPIENGKTYTITGNNYFLFVLDSDYKVLYHEGSDLFNNLMTFTINNVKARYVILDFRPIIYPLTTYMMVEGDALPDTYIPYFDNYYALKNSNYLSKNDLIDYGIYHEIYYVGPNREFTSFTDCLKFLKGNDKSKVIFIDGGTYDIFSEIGGKTFCSTIPEDGDWREYSVVVPDNTAIIGLGDVIFNFNPSKDEIGNGLKLLSPINISGTAHIENITINASNCRYCIHDETSGKEKFSGSRKSYKNVRCTKTGSGYAQAYAAGFDDLMVFEFDGCTFKSESSAVFSFHNRSTDDATKSSKININNCVFLTNKSENASAIRLGNINWKREHIKVNISNSYLDTHLVIFNEASYGIQNYDVTMLNCNQSVDVTLKDDDTNIYEPKIYN